MNYLVKPSILNGSINIPPSKSHTLRAILFASLATGKSTVRNYLPSPDTLAMINACQLLGAEISVTDKKLTIIGTQGQPKIARNIIDAGNSGQVLRFIGAVAALNSGYTVLTGDQSIRTNRPVQPLLDGLSKLGVLAVSTKADGYAPIIIKGPLQSGRTELNGEDSQPVSGLLIAAAFAEGQSEIHVHNPGEKPWINLTLDWFKKLGITCYQENYTKYVLAGGAKYPGFDYTVPGDFSSAAFPLVAALITGSEISLLNIDMQDVQGDKAIVAVLQSMGAKIEIASEQNTLHIKRAGKLIGQAINVNDFIDAVTILAVAACYAEGETRISGAAIAKKKESDRLVAITTELQKMGANITAQEDGLIIQPAKLTAASVDSHHDHRIAMSLAVAALRAEGETLINDIACVAKSYPDFAQSMQQLGAALTVQS